MKYHSYFTTDLSKCPGVLAPHEVQLYRHGEQQGQQVRHGQVEQVDVGGGPHVLVPQDHDTGRQVTQHTEHQE